MLEWIGTGALTLAVLLIGIETAAIFGLRTKAHCDCGAGWLASAHLRSWLILTISICFVVSTLGASHMVWRTVSMLQAAYYFWRWWQHTKIKRKKLKDKVLGVVRETAAGLRVVPVPGGTGA